MKFLYAVLGSVSLALGLIGIILPILPTTPFLLLTAFCFYKSSDRLYYKLMSHKCLETYIRDFRENKSIPLSTKIVSLSMLWLTILFSIIFFIKLLWIRILLTIIVISVSIHICSYKTKRNS